MLLPSPSRHAPHLCAPQIHGGDPARILDTGLSAAFAFARLAPTENFVCLFNVSETWQHAPADWLRGQGVTQFHDALSDAPVTLEIDTYALPPYGRVWMT